MPFEDMVSAAEFCIHHKIEVSFVYSLKEYGLIEVTTIGENPYLSMEQLSRLEMLVRFYYDMDINLEGIETITHLLDRTKQMQEQIVQLKNRLSRYEGE